MNYYHGIAQGLTCTCSFLLSLFIIWINVSVIVKLLLSLTLYHVVYLIIKLIQINPKFIRLEDYPIFIGPSIDLLSPAS
jgi:hypothetical protein